MVNLSKCTHCFMDRFYTRPLTLSSDDACVQWQQLQLCYPARRTVRISGIHSNMLLNRLITCGSAGWLSVRRIWNRGYLAACDIVHAFIGEQVTRALKGDTTEPKGHETIMLDELV